MTLPPPSPFACKILPYMLDIRLETGHCFQFVRECFCAIEISKYLYIMPAFRKGHILHRFREKCTELSYIYVYIYFIVESDVISLTDTIYFR